MKRQELIPKTLKIKTTNKVIELLKTDKYVGRYGLEIYNEFDLNNYISDISEANNWLEKYFNNLLEVIKMIKRYETYKFGDILTNFKDPRCIVDAIIFIVAEEVLDSSRTINKKWSSILSKSDCKKIIQELNNKYLSK